MVSLPKEANREAHFNMAVERARAKERKRAIQQFRQTAAGDVRASISHHCVSIDTLADDVLRTPDLGSDAWEFAPDVSTQCEKVMTFATEQNHVSNVGLALEIDWQRRMGIICAERAATFTTKAQGRNPSGRVEDGRRLLMRRGRRETKVVLQCVAEADQISMLGGFQKKERHLRMAVLFSPFYSRNLPRSCGGLAGSDGALPDFCEQTEAVTSLHRRLMNFSSYKPSFQILKLPAKPLAVSNLIALRATGRFASVHPFFASMRMACMWFGRLYTLRSSKYTLAEVQPSKVWVTGLTKPVPFWTVRKRMRKADPSATGRGRGRGDVAPIANR